MDWNVLMFPCISRCIQQLNLGHSLRPLKIFFFGWIKVLIYGVIKFYEGTELIQFECY